MALERKTRISDPSFLGRHVKLVTTNNITGDSVNTLSDGPWQMSGYQITDSEGHPWYQKPRPEGDIGGPFVTRRVFVEHASHLDIAFKEQRDSLITREVYDGYIMPPSVTGILNPAKNFAGNSSFPDYSSSDSTLNALGATAVSLCNPVNPVFDASTAIAELYRDGLPTIMGLKALKERRASSIGDEFLNWQFAVLPLFNDLKDLGKSIKTRETVLKQLRRDSGRLVRRRFAFPTTRNVISDTTETNKTVVSSYSSAFWNNTTGTLRKTVSIEQNRWFSGAFTYYLPDSSELGGITRMALEADKLFGVAPDIADLWNLVPWSWAVDWFVNVGPVLQNLVNVAKYGLVMPYGYMMEETIVRYQYSLTGAVMKDGTRGPFTMTVVDHTKKRVKASPFGFGVTWDSFNNTQLAILAALGLSKSPF